MGKNNKVKNQAMSSDPGSGDQNAKTVDPRFAKAHSDPRFQKFSKHRSKVPIDSRFSGMFTEKRFAPSAAHHDKRGKQKDKSAESDLSTYYRLDAEEGETKRKVKEGRRKRERADAKKDVNEIEKSNGGNSSDTETEHELEPSGVDSDEEVSMDTDATDSTTDTDEDDDMDLEDEASGEVENVPTIEKETHRLAIVNMDWTHVKASDLMVLLNSFLPKEGQILSVAIYPSKFGLKRLEEEAVRGPVALFEDEKKTEGDDSDDEEIDNEKLREYEKSRLRYYFGVVECDSIATADYLYKACDGLEFERSSNVLDLRFIPDEMEFKQPPRDRVTEVPAGYEGLDFVTRALQHSDVVLSWDEDEPDRVKTLKHKLNADQLADLELKEYLASDGSESEDDAEENISDKKSKKRDLYRALLNSGNGSEEEEEDKGQEMEVTFNTGLEDLSKKILEKKGKTSETVWEKYLRDRKERKKAKKYRSKDSSDDESDYSDRETMQEPDDFFVEEPIVKKQKKENNDLGKKKKKKGDNENMEHDEEKTEASKAELELLLADDQGGDTKVKGYKIRQAKRKGKKKGKEAPDEDKLPNIDLDDPRFAQIATNPLLALDPTDPQFKRSTTYMRQLAKQQQKTQTDLMEEEQQMKFQKQNGSALKKGDKNEDKPSDNNHEMALSVKSLKMKLKQASLPVSKKGKEKPESNKKRKHTQ